LGFIVETFDFTDRPNKEARAIWSGFEGEFEWEGHLLIEGHVGHVTPEPGDVDTAAIRLRNVTEGLACIGVACGIKFLDFCLRSKSFAIEGAD